MSNVKYQIRVLEIGNSQRSWAGFSLLELLVTVGVIATVGFITTASLFNIMQGISKAEITKEVKQNGDYALNAMERIIRNATTVSSTCDGIPTDTLNVHDTAGGTATFSCTTISADSTTGIASESASGTGLLTGGEVTLGTSCPGSLQFTCTIPDAGPPIVTVQFTLRQANAAANAKETANATFQTTISLRNQ